MSPALLFGIAGLLIISVSIWIRNEKKQDMLFALGGASLLVYSISIENIIFSVLQVVFILSSLIELRKLKQRK